MLSHLFPFPLSSLPSLSKFTPFIHSSEWRSSVLGDRKLSKTQRENRRGNQPPRNKGTSELPRVLQEGVGRHQLTRTCALGKIIYVPGAPAYTSSLRSKHSPVCCSYLVDEETRLHDMRQTQNEMWVLLIRVQASPSKALCPPPTPLLSHT